VKVITSRETESLCC